MRYLALAIGGNTLGGSCYRYWNLRAESLPASLLPNGLGGEGDGPGRGGACVVRGNPGNG